MPTTLNVIAAGPWHVGEFGAVRDAVDADRRWSTTPALRDAVELVGAAETPPALILLAQSHPGGDEQAEVEQLRQLSPLTRVVVVAGSWCEGELRTGRPLTGVVRIYWYEFPSWWRAALGRVARGESPPWANALTDIRAGQAARLDAENGTLPASHGQAQVVAIDTTDYAVFEALGAGMKAAGWNVVWQPRHRPALVAKPGASQPTLAAGIWDGGQLDGDEPNNLATFCSRLKAHSAPVVALLDFPRVEHLEQAQSAGAATLLAKPYQLALLHNELTRVLSGR